MRHMRSRRRRRLRGLLSARPGKCSRCSGFHRRSMVAAGADAVRMAPYPRRPMENATWTIGPCSDTAVRALVEALGVSPTTASVLVRRGHEDPAAARAFLDGALPRHDPFLLGDMPEAVERIHAAVAAGARICVHGDYDADGICATSLAVALLRELGAEPAWHLPSRFDEGYGLASQTIE